MTVTKIVGAVNEAVQIAIEDAAMPVEGVRAQLVLQSRRLTILVILLPYLTGAQEATEASLKILLDELRAQCKIEDNPEGVLGILDAAAAMLRGV